MSEPRKERKLFFKINFILGNWIGLKEIKWEIGKVLAGLAGAEQNNPRHKLETSHQSKEIINCQ